MVTPTKDQFEQELARVLAQRLHDNYGTVYKVQEDKEDAFLFLLWFVCVASLTCAAFLWVYLD